MVKVMVAAGMFVVLLSVAIIPAGHAVGGTEIGAPRPQKFSSYFELRDFINARLEIAGFGSSYFPPPRDMVWTWDDGKYHWTIGGANSPPVFAASVETTGFQVTLDDSTGNTTSELRDYSDTNIQVEGVDEADFIKTDGEFIYLVSGNTLLIIKAYPTQTAKVLSKIELDSTPTEILKNGGRLIIFGTKYAEITTYPDTCSCFPPRSHQTFVKVYNISDKENPVEEREMEIDGNYYDSRMVGNYVYLIVNSPLNYLNGEIELPNIATNGENRRVNASEVHYFDTFEKSYQFTIVLSLDLSGKNNEYSSKVFLMGYTQNIFVSNNNIYVTYRKGTEAPRYWDDLINRISKNLPRNVRDEIDGSKKEDLSFLQRVRKIKAIALRYYENLENDEKWDFRSKIDQDVWDVKSDIQKEATIVHRISISNGKIEHKAVGEVPGRVLNQFSMDEHQGYFRIATTTGHVSGWGNGTAKNHVYVLNMDLDIVGRLEDLAPGERIYSARFMGDRVYLVTFKKVDPLFVIDLKDPENPKVRGELKIPGYSDYLHMYDENHLIGIGKDTIESDWGGFAWYQGVKIALFDVSDPDNPKEISKYIVGARGTDSSALQDHKAFLFDREKNLLVVPIGNYQSQDAYVFHVSVENGIVQKGVITHRDNIETTVGRRTYLRDYNSSIKRSLYIENVLYTVSNAAIKMNDLEDLGEIGRISLSEPYEIEMVEEKESDGVESSMNLNTRMEQQNANPNNSSAFQSQNIELAIGSVAGLFVALSLAGKMLG